MPDDLTRRRFLDTTATAVVGRRPYARVAEREGVGDRLTLERLKALPAPDLDQQYIIGTRGRR